MCKYTHYIMCSRGFSARRPWLQNIIPSVVSYYLVAHMQTHTHTLTRRERERKKQSRTHRHMRGFWQIFRVCAWCVCYYQLCLKLRWCRAKRLLSWLESTHTLTHPNTRTHFLQSTTWRSIQLGYDRCWAHRLKMNFVHCLCLHTHIAHPHTRSVHVCVYRISYTHRHGIMHGLVYNQRNGASKWCKWGRSAHIHTLFFFICVCYNRSSRRVHECVRQA